MAYEEHRGSDIARLRRMRRTLEFDIEEVRRTITAAAKGG